MRNFATFYESVCAACPEARVEGLEYYAPSDYPPWWEYKEIVSDITEDIVRALCLRHWMGLMPIAVGVAPFMVDVFHGYIVFDSDNRAKIAMRPTPEEAIGEYLKARKG